MKAMVLESFTGFNSALLAFMFETRFPQQVSRFAAGTDSLQDDYVDCWAGLERRFDGTPDPK